MALPLTSLLLLLFFLLLSQSEAQDPPAVTGFACNATQTTYSCQTYAFYRALTQNYTDLASIGDLFEVSRLMIAEPSNISDNNVAEPLVLGQPLFVPLTCSCNSHNNTNISYANITYTIKAGNTFYLVSTEKFGNLTTYQSVELVNPTLVPTNLSIGADVIFPVFCKCPNQTQLDNQVNYLVSYVYQPSDNLSSIASTFEVDSQAIADVNGNNFSPYQTLFIPVSKLPNLTQPTTFPSTVPTVKEERTGLIRGLAIGLGIVGLLLILVIGFGFYRVQTGKKKEKGVGGDLGKRSGSMYGQKLGSDKEMEVGLMADVSDCLDKYKVFKIEELREATDEFGSSSLIQGSVYKGCIDGEVYAIKKMKWNAYEELKILQKVNHGNLVKLEGFCIDPQDGNCYLIYEFVENGSLDSWLHDDINKEKLNWKTRLRIAIDVANGLQYIHEHTRPRVVHKDIKSSNILLDSKMRAKIANFGLAKSGCNAITMHIVGTQGYIAPEYLADGVVSTKMDVFSFGVVLLELISGREAIDENGKVMWASAAEVLEGDEDRKMKKLKAWMDEILLTDTISMESVMGVMTVAVACTNKDPSKRLSMVDIVYALTKSDDVYFDVSDDSLSDPAVVAR